MIPDHPIIRNMMRTGTPDGKAPTYPVCPVCGEECSMVFIDSAGDVAGCSDCLSPKDAWDCPACFPEEE